MDDTNQPDDSTPVEPEAVGVETEQVPTADLADDDAASPVAEPTDDGASAPDTATRSARRKLWTVAAAAAVVGALGGVAVGAVGAEVFDDGPHGGRDGSAQGREHDRGRDDWGRGDWGGRGGPGRQAPGGDQQGGPSQQGPGGEQQSGQPGGQGGDWGSGGGHSRSGGS